MSKKTKFEKTNLRLAESHAHDIINKAKLQANEILSNSTSAVDGIVQQHKVYLHDKLEQMRNQFSVSDLEKETMKKTRNNVQKIYEQYHSNREEAVNFLVENITSFDIKVNKNLKVDQDLDTKY